MGISEQNEFDPNRRPNQAPVERGGGVLPLLPEAVDARQIRQMSAWRKSNTSRCGSPKPRNRIQAENLLANKLWRLKHF